MHSLGWLEGIFGTVRCANCGAAYGRDDVSVVGNRDEYWFVRCSCRGCGTQGIGVVIVKEVAAAVTEHQMGDQALEMDDVLVAHDLLQQYTGDMHGLFATGGSSAPG
jgi:hypothetical protein